MGGSSSTQRERDADANGYPGAMLRQQQMAAAARQQQQNGANQTALARNASMPAQGGGRGNGAPSPRQPAPRILVHGSNQFVMMMPQLIVPPHHVASSEAEAIKSCAASKASTFTLKMDDPDRWVLSFVVDSTLASEVFIFIGVEIELGSEGISLVPIDILSTPTLPPRSLPAGMNQSLTFDIQGVSEIPTLLQYDPHSTPTSVPFVVMVEYSTPSHGRQAHYSLLQKTEGGTRMNVIKELLEVQKTVYHLEHIYGGDVLENASPSAGGGATTSATTGGGGDDEEENMCVICLSAPLDTTVLPCRHFCMCSACAEIVKNRNPQQCPVCRTKIDQLLKRR